MYKLIVVFLLTQGDVFVCTLNPDLDFLKSEAGKSLIAKGKRKLQDRTKQRYPRQIKFGDVASISTADLLPCKTLNLGALPDWVKGSKDKAAHNAVCTYHLLNVTIVLPSSYL